MRFPVRAFAAIALLSPALLIPACGSSSNGGGPGGDAGTPGTDASVAPGSDATVGPGTDAAPSEDAGSPGTDTGITDAGPKEDTGILGDNCPAVDAASFVEGPHGPLPTVGYFGGGILQAPQIITFTFATTPGAATIESFGQNVTQSQWFADVSKDYCINDGGTCITPGAPGIAVQSTLAAQALYIDNFGQGAVTGGVDLEAFINSQIGLAVAAHTIPAPGPNSLYAFYFPLTSTISFGPPSQGGGESCSAFGGYHNSMTYTDGTTQIVYAIMPDCQTGDPATNLQYVTLAASHEIMEATTDPFVNTGLSWYLDQDFGEDGGPTVPQIRNEPWANADSFGEIGDNCESILYDYWFLDSGVQVQRIWSPFAAAHGHNPCIPVPAGESYYNASTDKVLYVADVGVPFTVDVSAFSDMPRSSWRLDALDWTPTQATVAGGGPLPYLKMDFVGEVDAGDGVSRLLCANNKTSAQLQVTLLSDPATDSTLYETWPEADGVILSADVAAWFNVPLEDGGSYQSFPYQVWPFAVVTPAIAASIGVTDAGVVDAKKMAALRHGGAHHSQPPRGKKPRGFTPPMYRR